MNIAPLTSAGEKPLVRTRVKILLVDDTPENLLSLEAALEPLGEELVFAHSGTEALRRVLQDDFAAILLDVRMPEMDGFETAQIIRTRSRSRSTPILFMTAYRGFEPLSRGYGLGAVDFLYKPIIPEILRSKVAVFVDLARKADELRRHGMIMQQQEHRFRSLLEVAPDSMVICRADGAVSSRRWDSARSLSRVRCSRAWTSAPATSAAVDRAAVRATRSGRTGLVT